MKKGFYDYQEKKVKIKSINLLLIYFPIIFSYRPVYIITIIFKNQRKSYFINLNNFSGNSIY